MGRTLQKSGLLTAAAQQMVIAIAVPGAVIIEVQEAVTIAAPEAVTMTAPEAVITITTIITTTVHGAEASSGSRLTRTRPFELNFLKQK